MTRAIFEEHKRFIRSLPCLICGNNIETECAHVRYTDRSVGRDNSKGLKPNDKHTVPLCGRHHREQHTQSEVRFWLSKEIDASKAGVTFWALTGDAETACRVIAYYNEIAFRG